MERQAPLLTASDLLGHAVEEANLERMARNREAFEEQSRALARGIREARRAGVTESDFMRALIAHLRHRGVIALPDETNVVPFPIDRTRAPRPRSG